MTFPKKRKKPYTGVITDRGEWNGELTYQVYYEEDGDWQVEPEQYYEGKVERKRKSL